MFIIIIIIIIIMYRGDNLWMFDINSIFIFGKYKL